MGIYNGYLTGEERDLVIENVTFENTFDRLNTLFEMTEIQLNQMYKDAEVKVFTEGGTYDDLVYLYEEADQQVAGQQQSILQKIIETIKQLFTSIGEKIKNIFSKTSTSPDADVTVPVETAEHVNAIQRAWNNMQAGVAKLRAKDFKGAWDSLKGIVIPAVGIGAVGGAIANNNSGLSGNTTTVKASVIDGWTKTIDAIKSKVMDAWNFVASIIPGIQKPDDQSNARESSNVFQKLISTINNVLSNITQGIAKIFGRNKQENPNIANDRKAGENGVTIKRVGTDEYRMDRNTGNIVRVSADGTETDVTIEQCPANIQPLFRRIKGKIAMRAAQSTQNQENQQAVSSAYQQTKTFTDPKTGNIITIEGRTGIIHYKDATGHVHRINDINQIGQFAKNRKVKKQIKEFHKLVMDGIDTANKAQDAIDTTQNNANGDTTTESVMDIDELQELFKETGYEVEIVNGNYIFTETYDAEIIDEIEQLVSEGYIVECTDEYYSISEHEISVTESVFGMDEELLMEDAFDEELNEVKELFENL